MTVICYVIRTKAYFSYHCSTIEALRRAGLDVRLYFDDYWTNHAGQTHPAFEAWHRAHSDIPIGYFPTRQDRLRRPLMFLRELRSYNSYCNRSADFKFYRERWSRYLKLRPRFRDWLVSPIGRRLAGSTVVRKFASAAERLSPSARNILAWLKFLAPSVVVVSPANMRFDEEIEVIKAARALGIRTVISVLSWDNLSTKGLIHIHPDLLLAWNDAHRNSATTYHHIDPKKIRITGSPFFDKWHDRDSKPAVRDVLCRRVGLDSARPYILYLGSSANIARDETWFVRELSAALANSAEPRLRQTQILFRPHPANWEIGLPLLQQGIAMWPRQGTLPDGEASFADFRDCLEHALCVVGINTSGMLDAIIYGKPVISPVLQMYELTQTKAQHFAWLREHGTIYLAADAGEVVDRVRGIGDGDDTRSENRRDFVAQSVWPRGIKAGDAQAQEIIALLPKKERQAAERQLRDHERNDMHAQPAPASAQQTSLCPAEADHRPPANTNLQPVFSSFHSDLERLRGIEPYPFYLDMRERILRIIGESDYALSTYWYEEVIGFDYLFDASPLVIAKIRQHCYHITGDRSNLYRHHHAHAAQPLLDRLAELQKQDRVGLFVPESNLLGGFGYVSDRGLINVDTLKFYEVLIGLERSGFLEPFLHERDKRHAVLEIGGGWGGFVYQFLTLFPATTCFIVDLPATLLFSAVYLRGVFPNARIVLMEKSNADEILENWMAYDVVLVAANDFSLLTPRQLDLAVNMVSFQEMTTAQVRGYLDRLADISCPRIYSMNRDRNRNNPELAALSLVLSERYDLALVQVLDTDYAALGAGKVKADRKPTNYHHYAGRLRGSFASVPQVLPGT